MGHKSKKRKRKHRSRDREPREYHAYVVCSSDDNDGEEFRVVVSHIINC